MTAADIQALLAEGDEQIVNKMMNYGATLRGTRAYWLARRHELADALQIQGCPAVFWTLSAADLQWPDLHRHMPQEIDVPPDDERAARRQRRLALNRNPHLAAEYLDLRVQLFLKEVMAPLFGVKHFWYRYEWQDRGSGHVHGFFWLNNAPDMDKIDWDLLKDPNAIISDDQTARMLEFTTFFDRLIKASNPFPRTDENTPLIGVHPCNRERSTLQNNKAELAEILNWVERHTKCMPGYCQVKRSVPGQTEKQTFCRFDYPMPHRDESGVGLDSKHRPRFEPKRNDRLLNTHNVPMILGWRANIDIKPVMSTEAALQYVFSLSFRMSPQTHH